VGVCQKGGDKMLINEATQESINILIQRGFIHNRTLDNFLGFANVEWAFLEFSKRFHASYAHLFPLVSDRFADILLRYNVIPKYYETPRDTRKYSSMLDFFEINLKEHEETYDLIKNAIIISQENGDINVEADLKQMLRMWNEFMNQAILLRDKAEIYKDDIKLYDSFSSQFYTLKSVKKELTGGGE
jgi:hypothetical protein